MHKLNYFWNLWTIRWPPGWQRSREKPPSAEPSQFVFSVSLKRKEILEKGNEFQCLWMMKSEPKFHNNAYSLKIDAGLAHKWSLRHHYCPLIGCSPQGDAGTWRVEVSNPEPHPAVVQWIADEPALAHVSKPGATHPLCTIRVNLIGCPLRRNNHWLKNDEMLA